MIARILGISAVAILLVAAAESPISPVASTVRSAVNTRHALETVNRVYDTDHWFTFSAFEKTAAYLKTRFEEAGLVDIEIGGAHADGKTQAVFWTMPLAWDVASARLELRSPTTEVLCDYSKIPTCLGMWSGPTPPVGVDAELVEYKGS